MTCSSHLKPCPRVSSLFYAIVYQWWSYVNRLKPSSGGPGSERSTQLQLGERPPCTREDGGSNPLASTTYALACHGPPVRHLVRLGELLPNRVLSSGVVPSSAPWWTTSEPGSKILHLGDPTGLLRTSTLHWAAFGIPTMCEPAPRFVSIICFLPSRTPPGLACRTTYHPVAIASICREYASA